jgi:hypothetical protein
MSRVTCQTAGSPCGAGSRCAHAPVTALAVGLPQHPDQRRPGRPVLVAVDQQLGEGGALLVAPDSRIRSARSKSGSFRTWSSSARGAGPRASRRSRSRRSSSSGLMAEGYAVEPSPRVSDTGGLSQIRCRVTGLTRPGARRPRDAVGRGTPLRAAGGTAGRAWVGYHLTRGTSPDPT